MLSKITWSQRPNEASDIYAAGMTFFELGTQERPFSDIRSPEKAAEQALDGQRPEKPLSLGGISGPELTYLWETMAGAWAQEPSQRPVAEHLYRDIHDSADYYIRCRHT